MGPVVGAGLAAMHKSARDQYDREGCMYEFTHPHASLDTLVSYVV
jgi:hypothetical protein